jgi:hypothetical protein
MQNNEPFGDSIKNLKVDSVANSAQQSSLQVLNNILETIKPSSGQEQFAIPEKSQIQQKQIKPTGVQQVASPVQSNFSSVKKTAIISVLFIILNTEVFRKIISRFTENTMFQTLILTVIFAALTLLVIRFYNA